MSVTGWQLLALRAAKNIGCDVPGERIDMAVEYVLRCRDSQQVLGRRDQSRNNQDVTDDCSTTGEQRSRKTQRENTTTFPGGIAALG